MPKTHLQNATQATKKIKKLTSLRDRIFNLAKVPMEIREVSLSLFLFTIGWGLGGDTFFSVYMKNIIGTGIWLTLIGTLLPLIKLFIVMPIWTLNDKGHGKNLLLSGKMFYAFSALFYFLAGVNQSALLLVIAVIFNGIWSATMYTTYRSLYGNNSCSENRTQVFGVYFSSINIAYVIGAIISSWLVWWLDLPYMYLFIVIFGILSILQDGNIQDFIHHKVVHKRKPFGKKREKKLNPNYRLVKDFESLHNYLGKWGFLHNFWKEIFSLKAWKRTFAALRSYQRDMKVALGTQSLVNFVNYVGYLFIPLIAIEKNLSLSEIALLFGAMKLPYLVNIFIWNLGDRYNKKLMISLLFSICAVFFVLMGSLSSFGAILGICFGISLMVAILQPISTALITSYARPEDKGLMAGLSELVSKIGEIAGSLGFGILSGVFGIQVAFQLAGLGLGILGGYSLVKKIIKRGDN